MPLRDLLLGLMVIAIWAFNILVIKIGVAELPPLLMTTLRFILVAALLVPFYPVVRVQLPFLLLLSFTFGSLHFALLFIGLGQSEAGTGALLVQMGTPFATLLAVVFLKETLGPKRLAGLLLSFTGVIVIAGGPTFPSLLPLMMLLLSALGWAVSQLLIKRGPPIAPLALAGWVALFAVPQVAVGSWLFESQQWQAIQQASWKGWGAMIYSAIMSSIVAYGIWYALLRRHPVNRIVPMTLLTPVLAVFLGALLLGEHLGIHKMLGGGLVVAGISLIVLNLSRRRSTTTS